MSQQGQQVSKSNCREQFGSCEVLNDILKANVRFPRLLHFPLLSHFQQFEFYFNKDKSLFVNK